MKIKIVWIGKTREPAIDALTNEYLKRLKHYAEVETSVLKDESGLSKLSGREARSVRYDLVLLDSRGKQMSSEEFAALLGEHQDRNLPLAFAIGPSDGFSAEIRAQAKVVLSLGRMTLAHELARVVIFEQLYRAFTILKRHPYHLGH